MTYSITGFLAGQLKDKYIRWSLFPFMPHGILLLSFFCIHLRAYQLLFEVDILQYLLRWFLTKSYTLIFLLILQFFFPIKRIQGA
ncbi:MAG: hypothetical protein CM1200mP10_05710 [Candidatus Neomarinimicrobiota bacterium]|nr:MAG: hypothetical protein CM1200mP10_05710 [Candidatus Neomarinimicrobiota bacterium]